MVVRLGFEGGKRCHALLGVGWGALLLFRTLGRGHVAGHHVVRPAAAAHGIPWMWRV